MTPLALPTGRGRGFTLIELLVVIGAMAILAGILIPVIRIVTQAARVANTESLIGRIDLALTGYMREQGLYPPDFVPSAQQYYHMHAKANPNDDHRFTVPGSALPPEALHYFVANPYVGANAPYTSFRQGSETQDYDHDGLREVVDAWGYPLLYNRGKFPGCGDTHYNYSGSSPYEDTDHKPWHSKDSFDLFSIGADRKTRKKDTTSDEQVAVTDPGSSTNALATFVEECIGQGLDAGEGTDDVNSWKR